MKRWVGLLFASVVALPNFAAEVGPGEGWPHWRGPLDNGVAPHARPPTRWSETTNLRWKTPLPGLGHSTPIIFGGLVVVTAAVPFGPESAPVYSDAEGAHDNHPVKQAHRFVVIALAQDSGEPLWQTTVKEEVPHEGGHFTGSLASNSPITDGERIYADFGSRGIYCLARDGRILWRNELGRLQTRHAHGEGSSPALSGRFLVINRDHERQSFVTALDKENGRELWRVERDEMTSWSSPLIVEVDGNRQVVVSATGAVRGYDLGSGKEIWSCRGLSRNVVATPVFGAGTLFAANSYDWQALLAIRLSGARGDLTDTGAVLWKRGRLTPYVPSPLLYGERLCFIRHNQNILSIVHPKTGEDIDGPFRLPGIREVFGSPVAADGRLYITDRSGSTVVIGLGAKIDILGVNRLQDSFSASAAVVGDAIFLRGEKSVYCLADVAGQEKR